MGVKKIQGGLEVTDSLDVNGLVHIKNEIAVGDSDEIMITTEGISVNGSPVATENELTMAIEEIKIETTTQDAVVLHEAQAYTDNVLAQAKENGDLKGEKGDDGYTPIRGTDYWTEADKAEIKAYVDDAILNGVW